MDPNHLISGYKKIIKELYKTNSYYKRISSFLELFNPRNSFHLDFQYLKINRSYLLGVPRIIVKFGLFEKERIRFWYLFFKTLFQKPKAFFTVLAQIVSGYHIKKIYERNQ